VELQPGDYVVFTNAGAYDITMSYGFGDGVGRPIEFLP
jgi:diaminopimelate decarboxylase